MLQIALRLPFGWYIGHETKEQRAHHAPLRDVAYLSPCLQCDLGVGRLYEHENTMRAFDYRLRYLL